MRRETRTRSSNQFSGAEAFETGGGEGGEFAKKDGVDLREVKTGLALHALPKFRRDALLQIWSHIHGHEVVAHVVLAQANCAETNRLARLTGQKSFEIVELRLVADDAETFFIRGQDFLQ